MKWENPVASSFLFEQTNFLLFYVFVIFWLMCIHVGFHAEKKISFSCFVRFLVFVYVLQISCSISFLFFSPHTVLKSFKTTTNRPNAHTWPIYLPKCTGERGGGKAKNGKLTGKKDFNLHRTKCSFCNPPEIFNIYAYTSDEYVPPIFLKTSYGNQHYQLK